MGNIFEGGTSLIPTPFIVTEDTNNNIWIKEITGHDDDNIIVVSKETAQSMAWAMLKATALDKPDKVGRWFNCENYETIILNDRSIEYINAFSNEYKGKWIFIESEG